MIPSPKEPMSSGISDATNVPLKWILALLCFAVVTGATLIAGRLSAAESANTLQDLRLQRLEDDKLVIKHSLQRIERKLGIEP